MSFSQKILAFGLLAILCAITYGGSLYNGFLLDDHEYFFNSPTLSDVSYVKLFTADFKGMYRPMGYWFPKLEMTFLKDWAFGYSVIAVLFWYFTAVLFFIIVWKLSRDFLFSLLSSALYLIHPVNNTMANFKIAVVISICLIFMQLSTLFFLNSLEGRRNGPRAASILFYFLSMMAHEISFILPAYFFVIFYFKKESGWKSKLIMLVPYGVVFIIYFLIRSVAGGRGMDQIGSMLYSNIPIKTYITSFVNVMGWYFSKLFFPKDLLFMWGLRIEDALIWQHAFWVLIMICLIVLSVRNRKNPSLAWAPYVFLIGFIPVFLGCFTFSYFTHIAVMEPHWLTFSSIGFFALFAQLLLKLKEFIGIKLWTVMVLVIVFACLVLSRQENAYWKNEERYCMNWLRVNPINRIPHVHLARIYVDRYDFGLNKEKYQNCAEVAYLAGQYKVLEKFDKAKDYYDMALEMDDNCVSAYWGLGNLYNKFEYFDLARQYYEQTIKLQPDFTPAHEALKRMEVP